MSQDDYREFLASKLVRAEARGLSDIPPLAGHLFEFQKHCVDFLLRVGCAGLFLDTGLGKTRCQLEWSRHAIEASNGRGLILTPLAVARQIEKEGLSLGYPCRVIRDQSEAKEGINICNYDRLERLDPSWFGAVSLDEASILKSFTGKTTRKLINLFRYHRWKMVATATPAPNDHMELGNYAEFLNIMSSVEMLSRFFINDTSTASQQWRLKGHAEITFWDWMASWCRMAEKPADLGDDITGFDLPPFNVYRHRSRDSKINVKDGSLFASVAMNATTMHDIKRQTAEARAERVASLVDAEKQEPWVLWCDTDYEADALQDAIPGAIEIRGSQSIDKKEANLVAFAEGQSLYLIAKPSMCGHGLNWQHCARMAFIGRSFSYETYYQAVRRCWRYGQKRSVDVHLIVAEGEAEIGRVIDHKAGDHADMKDAMRAAMVRNMGVKANVKVDYNPRHNTRLPLWIRSVA